MFKSILLVLFVGVATVHAATIKEIENYNANSTLQMGWAMGLLQRVELEGSERILDVGSGTGKITAQLAQNVPSGLVVGLDISAEMTAFAAGQFEHPNLVFMHGDLCTVPFEQQFDLVFANCALIWIADQRGAFQSIENSLVPGGMLLAVQPESNPRNLAPTAERLIATPRWSPHFPDFKPQRFYLSQEEAIEQLVAAGLEPLLVEVTYSREFYPSMEAFLDWLRPIAAFTDRLPPALREQFLREMAAEMVDIDTNGVWLPDNKLEVIARRPLQSRAGGNSSVG